MQLNCAREDGDFKTLSSPVKSYKGPRIVAFVPLVSFTGCFDHGSLFYVQVAWKKDWHRFRARANFSRTPIRISEKTFPFRKKTKRKKKQKPKKQAHTHVYGVVSKNNVDYSKRFLLSSHHEIRRQEFKLKERVSVTKLNLQWAKKYLVKQTDFDSIKRLIHVEMLTNQPLQRTNNEVKDSLSILLKW